MNRTKLKKLVDYSIKKYGKTYQMLGKEEIDSLQKLLLLSELKQTIRKEFGPKCPDFNWFCASCSAWLAYEILEELLSLDEQKEREK